MPWSPSQVAAVSGLQFLHATPQVALHAFEDPAHRALVAACHFGDVFHLPALQPQSDHTAMEARKNAEQAVKLIGERSLVRRRRLPVHHLNQSCARTLFGITLTLQGMLALV